jgi:hypothetical protein
MLCYTQDDLVLGVYHLISKKKILETHFKPHVKWWQGTYDVGSNESMNMSITNICNWILSQEPRTYLTLKTLETSMKA